ncbi:MAG: amidohydrolase family protein [Acidimicrobiaceae bacterium]|nr:amidohydrolase family protein [Acidimicrobiaceae bacterium]MBT6092600.1 amidohydrolase family protein [Acidimicrobiaceae bacterium]
MQTGKYDLLIQGGLVVDGTGAPGVTADVAVTDGRIVAVGDLTGSGANEVINATGKVVCPGFVDPHTHYDAQLFWDPYATPSCQHGITSVVMGNCGFSIAPLGDDTDAEYLAAMLVRVEGMSPAALAEGVDWNWRSFGDFLDRFEGNLGVNAAGMVGHSALRRTVMKDDAVTREATPDELIQMQLLLAESLEAGGLGFSTSRSFTHSDGDGRPVPSRTAAVDEVVALCGVCADHPGTTLEWVADGCLNGFTDEEVDLMSRMSLAARRPVNWNVLTIDSARPDDYRNQLAACDRVAEAGGRAVALTMPILVGMNMHFHSFCALYSLPDWGDVMNMDHAEKMVALGDPETRRFLEERAASPDAGVFSRLTGWGLYRIGDTFSEANEGLKGRLVGDIARERGHRDFYTLLDIVQADDLRTVLWPGPTDDDPPSWLMRQAAWDHDHVMIGGSDAGAHLDRMAGASYTTQWLADCLRGRQLATLEGAIAHMTDVPARFFGISERGRIVEGWHADLVVLDPATVGAGEFQMRNDLPGNSPRLYADAIGIERVYVNGTCTVVDGTPTGNLPGSVIRSGTDTETTGIPADA